MMIKRRIDEDFKHVWAINWNGLPEDFSDATEIVLTASVYGKKKQLERGVDYVIEDNLIIVDFTPRFATITGIYNLELKYIKPSDGFIDGERRSAIDLDVVQIVARSSQVTDTGDITSTSEAAFGFQGLSAYEVWLKDNPDSTKEDYFNWLQKPATDAVSLIEDKIDELDTAIQQESERVEAEDIRLSNEQSRVDTEELRVSGEVARNTAEGIRVGNENTRSENEGIRLLAEEDRVEAENIRVENEILRISAELLREGAESDREDAEQLRQTNISTAIQNANEATQNANSAAELANTKAGEANTATINADNARLAIQGDLALKADQTELDQLAGDVIQKSSTLIGDNLFNPNYVSVGEQLWMKGGDGTLITTNSIVANASFYTTPTIKWGDASKMIAKRVRSYVQLDGLFNPIAFYYPSSSQDYYVITKEGNAKYIKISCNIVYKPENIVNYGETLILYRPYRENKVYNAFSNTEVTDREIIDIKNRIKTFNNTITGNNLFNPYYSPISNEEWAKGGINTLITDIGLTVSSAGWYTTSLVEWKENSTMFAKRYRSWVQLNEYMDVIAVDYPLAAVSNQQISKSEGAKYIKICVPWSSMSTLKLEMLNYGSVALPYEEYHEESINTYTGYDYTDYYLRLKEYIINESFTVPSVTYDANGVIVSPLNVLWADGGTGQLTITRNSNFNITKILATYLKNDVSINMTLNINRDINDNVTSVTF